MNNLNEEQSKIEHFLNSIRSILFEELNFSFKDVSSIDERSKMALHTAVARFQESFPLIKDKSNKACVISKPGLQLHKADMPEHGEVPLKIDDNLVQIKVSREELDRRITSFITRKRKEVDESNSKEFCSKHFLDDDNPLLEEINSCARVDAVFVPRAGCKSHVKVSRVDNVWGPQTVQPSTSQVSIKQEAIEDVPYLTLEDIEERLKNMESHLKIKSGINFRRSVYTRLKDLEERILFLEGISPDYFHTKQMSFMSPKKRLRKEKVLSKCNVEELQQRMQDLKYELKHKSSHRKSHLFQH